MESASKNVQDLQLKRQVINTVKSRMQRCAGQKREGGKGRSETRRESDVIRECYRCKGKHSPTDCLFRNAKCQACEVTGHIAKACNKRGARTEKRSDRRPQERDRYSTREQAHYCSQQAVEKSDEEEGVRCMLSSVRRTGSHRIVCMGVNGKELTFEIDTGFTLVSERTFKDKVKQALKFRNTHLCLRTYKGEAVPVLGKTYVTITYQQQTKTLPIIVVKSSDPNLLGRWWLKHIKLDWSEIKHLRNHPQSLTLQDVLYRQKSDLGTLKGFKATMQVPADATPQLYRPKFVPYAIKPKLDAEIDRLLAEDIITPVKFSDWAARVVPLIKPDGNCRLSGDYKLTVNKL